MAAVTGDAPVLAAGGVVWRPGAGHLDTCLVHRPRYDDWSLPKGKLTPGEHPLAAAMREVAEETGVRAVPQARLPTVEYDVRGRGKRVEYWLMRARAYDDFQPNDEVDELRWVPLADALHMVSYDRDKQVLRHAITFPAVTAVVLLIRHGHAGERDDWPGPDAVRPLDRSGEAQAHALADLLGQFAPDRLVSATPDRCRQTLAPLAAATGLPIEPDELLDETADPTATATRLRDLASFGREPVVACSQGKLIPRTLEKLAATDKPAQSPVGDYATGKGTGWLLAFDRERLVGADRIAPCRPGDKRVS